MSSPKAREVSPKVVKDPRAKAHASPAARYTKGVGRNSKAASSVPPPKMELDAPAVEVLGKPQKSGDVQEPTDYALQLLAAALQKNRERDTKGDASGTVPEVQSNRRAVRDLRPPQKGVYLQQPKKKAPPLLAAVAQKTAPLVERDDSGVTMSSPESSSPASPSAFSARTNRSSRPVLRVTAGNVYLDYETPPPQPRAPLSRVTARPRMPALAETAHVAASPGAALSTRYSQQDSPLEERAAKREQMVEQRDTPVYSGRQLNERYRTVKPTARGPEVLYPKELRGEVMPSGSPRSPPGSKHQVTAYKRFSRAKEDKVLDVSSRGSSEQAISPVSQKRPGQATSKKTEVEDSKTMLGFVAAPKAPLIPYRPNQQDDALGSRKSSDKGVPLEVDETRQLPRTTSPVPTGHAELPAPVKAITASKPRPKPQRYEGFPGVPAYIGAPDVIIFTPRSVTPKVSPTTASGRPEGQADRGPSPAFFSPAVTSSNSESVQRIDDSRMTFLQCWLLSGVALGTSMLPLGLLLLSYTSTPYSSSTRNRTTWITLGSTTTGGTITSQSVFTLPVHTSTRSGATVVPSSCIHSPRKVGDQNRLLVGSASRFTASPKALVFCLYNNSRYSKGGRYDFGPDQLPFPYCNNIVYWSLGVDDGVIQSRAPHFDLTHGIGVLRQNIINRGIGNATLLVAIGGYSEDAPQFSRLGADASAMSRFASSVIYLLQTYHLDGVALHWIGPEEGCRGADDATTLARVLRTVRQSVLASGYNGLVTVILPGEDVQSRLSRDAVETVDYIFLEAHLELAALVYSLSHCDNFGALITGVLQTVPDYDRNQRKICAVYSLAPLLLDTVTSGIATDYILSNASRYSGTDGKGTVFEMCEEEMCLSSSGNVSCVTLNRNVQPSTPGMTRSYVFYNRKTIFDIVSHGHADRQFVSKDRCLLLNDMDLDNFNMPCLLNRTFNSLHHFHSAMERTPHLATPLVAAPGC